LDIGSNVLNVENNAFDVGKWL